MGGRRRRRRRRRRDRATARASICRKLLESICNYRKIHPELSLDVSTAAAAAQCIQRYLCANFGFLANWLITNSLKIQNEPIGSNPLEKAAQAGATNRYVDAYPFFPPLSAPCALHATLLSQAKSEVTVNGTCADEQQHSDAFSYFRNKSHRYAGNRCRRE